MLCLKIRKSSERPEKYISKAIKKYNNLIDKYNKRKTENTAKKILKALNKLFDYYIEHHSTLLASYMRLLNKIYIDLIFNWLDKGNLSQQIRLLLVKTDYVFKFSIMKNGQPDHLTLIEFNNFYNIFSNQKLFNRAEIQHLICTISPYTTDEILYFAGVIQNPPIYVRNQKNTDSWSSLSSDLQDHNAAHQGNCTSTSHNKNYTPPNTPIPRTYVTPCQLSHHRPEMHRY